MLINDRCSQLRAFEFEKLFFSFHFPPDFDRELEARFPISRSAKELIALTFFNNKRCLPISTAAAKKHALSCIPLIFFEIKPAQGCLRIQAYRFQFVHEANSQVDRHATFNLALYPAMF